MGRPPANPVVIVPYDQAWPAMFASEAEAIRAAGGRVVTAIEHVGSTSVPGLAAKPIIDIQLHVTSLVEADVVLDTAMRGLRYECFGEYGIPGRRYFARGMPRTHHVHAFERDNPEAVRHLLFRDYLRAHTEAAREYAGLKESLALRFTSDREAYTEAKTEFIREVLRLAGWRE